MTINSDEVWVVDEDKPLNTATPLTSFAGTKESFDSWDEIKEFLKGRVIKNEYEEGNYTLLTKKETLEIESKFSEFPSPLNVYTERKQKRIKEVAEEIKSRGSVAHVLVPDSRSSTGWRANGVHNISLYLTPYDYDIRVNLELGDEEDEETAASELNETYDDFHLIGWKPTVNRERRGAPGRSAVNIFLRLKGGYFRELYDETIEEYEKIVAVFRSRVISYSTEYMKVGYEGDDPDEILITNIELETDDLFITDDQLWELPHLTNREFDKLEEGLTGIGWGLHSLGVVVGLDGLYLGIGIQKESKYYGET